jgi:hypothetical protein
MEQEAVGFSDVSDGGRTLSNPEPTLTTLDIAVRPQDIGCCYEINSPVGEPICSYGQLPYHAIACALEQLAEQYL